MPLEATKVQLEQEVSRTPDDIRTRYRENRNWPYFPKEWIYRNIPLEGKDVLDFGCGTGEITTQLAFLGARRVYALDVTPGLLESTWRRAQLDGVAGRVEPICGFVQDVEPRKVDVIIAFAVLHHCFPLENVLPSLTRWLKPGGVFVAVEPVSYLKPLEALRVRSGVAFDPLDEGERKLNPADLRYVSSLFAETQVSHFHLLGRLTRVLPAGDAIYRRMDRVLLSLPGVSKFAGTAVIVGRAKENSGR